MPKLAKVAIAGEDAVIANNGRPVVTLVRIAKRKIVRKPGAWRTLPPAAEDWDTPGTTRLSPHR